MFTFFAIVQCLTSRSRQKVNFGKKVIGILIYTLETANQLVCFFTRQSFKLFAYLSSNYLHTFDISATAGPVAFKFGVFKDQLAIIFTHTHDGVDF